MMATKNKSELIGQGGFGSVYKGVLENGLHVAIKSLSKSSHQGAQEFLNEVFHMSILLPIYNFFLFDLKT